jgi:hypothetical protein
MLPLQTSAKFRRMENRATRFKLRFASGAELQQFIEYYQTRYPGFFLINILR